MPNPLRQPVAAPTDPGAVSGPRRRWRTGPSANAHIPARDLIGPPVPCPDPNSLQAACDGAATGISNSNHVVEWADRPDGSTRAVITVPVNGQLYVDANADLVNGLIVDIGTLRGDTDPVGGATAVKDDG